MRLLGIDYGDKNIGIAVSDPTGTIASAVEVIRREDPRAVKKPIARIVELVREYNADTIVLGYPKNMDNTEGFRCEKTIEFCERLKKSVNIPVVMTDERLSTVRAERTLLEADLSRQKRREVIDKMAAQFILQGYLDRLGNEKRIDSDYIPFSE